jgi:hypothetical protein
MGEVLTEIPLNEVERNPECNGFLIETRCIEAIRQSSDTPLQAQQQTAGHESFWASKLAGGLPLLSLFTLGDPWGVSDVHAELVPFGGRGLLDR